MKIDMDVVRELLEVQRDIEEVEYELSIINAELSGHAAKAYPGDPQAKVDAWVRIKDGINARKIELCKENEEYRLERAELVAKLPAEFPDLMTLARIIERAVIVQAKIENGRDHDELGTSMESFVRALQRAKEATA